MRGLPITPRMHGVLSEELKSLRLERDSVLKEVQRTRAYGDLSENAEYHDAKKKAGYLKSRIDYLETRLTGARVVIRSMINPLIVAFGATVYLFDGSNGMHYTIVCEDEARFRDDFISFSSPLARQFLGKKVGDLVGANVVKKISYEALDNDEFL